jgi:D-3-phosphoglycerate dehydrogenase / 2-oxoglutarate reductase
MEKKVLVIDKVHPLITSELEQAGFQCDHFPGFGRKEIEGIIGGYRGIIIRSGIAIDRPFLEKATGLEFIARVGSGLENIDTEFAASLGIRCLNSPEGNRDAVGEHTTGLLLALLNHFVQADRQVRQGKWLREENRGTEVKGKTVGIIGYGNMGSAFAQRLQGFDADVISYDKYKTGYSDGSTRETDMEELFASCDILSLHVPLTAETRYLVDEKFIARFAKPFCLLNTARGKVVRTQALVAGLKSGKILGAALDVLEYEDTTFEQISDKASPDLDFLKAADNVILTPHIAGWTRESSVKLATVLAEKILKIQ